MIKSIIILLLIALVLPIPAWGETIAQDTQVLSDAISTVFNFIISGAGLIAFLALLMGGLRYLTAAGSPMAMAKAKKQAWIIGRFFDFNFLFNCSPNQSRHFWRNIFSPRDVFFGLGSPNPSGA